MIFKDGLSGTRPFNKIEGNKMVCPLFPKNSFETLDHHVGALQA